MKISWMILGSLFAMSVTTACSDNSTSSTPQTVKVAIRVVNPEQAQSSLVTEVVPSFVGLGVGEGAARTSHSLNIYETTTVEVPVGTVLFRAKLVSALATNTTRVMYVSQASQTVSVTSATTEVTLGFEPYTAAEQVNVYGLVHTSNTVPAANTEVSVQDPASGAWLAAPGNTSLALTNSAGAFGFSLPLNAFLTNGNLTLRVVSGANTRVLTLPANTNGKPGVTLPYINLSGASEGVVPAFTNLTDFDNDGTPNAMEITAGTNPFSELSGQAGPQGPQGPAGGAAKVRNAAGTEFSVLGSSSSELLLKFSDGVLFPYSATSSPGGYSWYGYSNTGRGVVSRCTNAAGVDFSSSNCGYAANNPWPYNWEACYFDNSACTGTCYVPFKPVANRIIPACIESSSGGTGCVDFRKTTGQEALTTSFVPTHYREFMSYSSCSSISSGGGTATFWAIPTTQQYTFPAGVTYPLGTLYLVE